MSISTSIDVTNITSDITSDMNSNIAENRPPSSIGVVSSPQPSASAVHPQQHANKYDLGSSSIPSRHERNKMHNLIDLESRRGKRGMASCTVQSVSTRGGKKGGEVLLHPMTLLFPESQVTAIMGPQHAGKTTLLNFITGTIHANLDAEGSVNLSGQNGQIAFVPKEDFLHSWRTCRTYMGHYTRLSGLKDNFSNAKLSMDILVRLGMEDHADTIVGDVFRPNRLNPGQKKRLSIALESLSRPETLILDEPTTNLDVESSFQVMKFLSDYSRVPGRRVIITVHDPSSYVWRMIDNVVLLSKGKLMYQGPRNEIEAFFAKNERPCPPHFNPSDHYITVVNDDFHLNTTDVDEWALRFSEWQAEGRHQDIENATNIHATMSGSVSAVSIQDTESVSFSMSSFRRQRKTTIVTDVQPSTRGNLFETTRELTRHYLVDLSYNPATCWFRLGLYTALSLVIGAIFFDVESKGSERTKAALLFYCCGAFSFLSLSAVPFAVIERKVIANEITNRYYHPAIFHASKAFASLFNMFVIAVVSTAIIIGMTDLKKPIEFCINVFLSLNCAEATTELICNLFQSSVLVTVVISGIYAVFLLLQGFIIPHDELPLWLRWANNVPFHTYSWRAFMHHEFDTSNSEVLSEYDINDVKPAMDMWNLVIYTAVLHVLSILVLSFKHYRYNSRQVMKSSSAIAEENFQEE